MPLRVEIQRYSADVMRGDAKVATFMLDPFEQMDGVIIFPNATSAESALIVQLAASHAASYVKARQSSVLGGLMVSTYGDKTLTAADSHRLLRFDSIAAEIAEGPDDELVLALKEISIPVIRAVHYTPYEALLAVIGDERLGGAVEFVAAEPDFMDRVGVEFKATGDNSFRFWHHVSKRDGGKGLYIVPAYHPTSLPQREYVALLNGDTDANISGKAIRAIHSPVSSRTEDAFGSTWSRVDHPFYVSADAFTVTAMSHYLISQDGVEETVRILMGALEYDGGYIAISGGFRPPSGTPTIHHGGERLGSEEFCYWAREVLESEGELARAHVPHWMR